MKTFAAAIFFVLFSFFPAAAQTENGGLRRLSDKEIDAQLRNMQDLLPVEIQSGIRWVDIKRSGREIKYTYIVNVNSAEWSDGERMAMMTRLQDFGCRQLLPAAGSKTVPSNSIMYAASSLCGNSAWLNCKFQYIKKWKKQQGQKEKFVIRSESTAKEETLKGGQTTGNEKTKPSGGG